MDSCPVGHADEVCTKNELIENYSKCLIGFEFDGGDLGNCRRCGRAYNIDPKTYAQCPNEWIVCGDCLWEYNCSMNYSKELPEAKVGSIIWI